ncbi:MULTISPECIES: 3-isopropylmalate dehydratase large subunit [Empedobacter]|uniref:3-isopropylmalate dehydratase large subunit n=1 Tax=Empedobacter falsenii TaxID=343874 RepID=A0A376GI33_9FLAO|nr:MULTISPECIES: 3-isopropylmalate dehydratase large subunit [Empedobacter]MDH1883011.1 3-isopropylmalate dehydratase large subunit [Empedobacter sp. GD03797]MDM1042432.1 3-isopropylmalate dehydratase large subunit [Empedobacter brevis]MDM1136374.1 3-isopropylmalate dehydratase large subunit [Empedobacter sp. R750]STD59630.1 3-isopropylmalate dehydratase large subunit [Empedobacter falsenii]
MRTLFDKVWDAHVVSQVENGPQVVYIDKHLIHEVTSPQAFAELEARNIPIFRPDQIVATADHNVPTINQDQPVRDPLSKQQLEQLAINCEKNNITFYGLGHPYQGIVHIIAPELGVTQPGMSMVCGDSHTSTHGAFGAIAFGIGTSQVAQVFASQCLLMNKPKSMRIKVNGKLNPNVQPKDVILYIISKVGTNAGTGFFCEYAGDVFENMSMEGRMTVCNMSIEMGARGGMIAPDETTFAYLKDKPFAPKGEEWEQKVAYWKTLPSDADAIFDEEIEFDAADIYPMITFGTNPGMGISVKDIIPSKDSLSDNEKESFEKALKYMGFQDNQSIINHPIDYVFIGSCTNARIEDLREVANYVKGKQRNENVTAWIVPGSKQVEKQAIEEGLDKIFEASGFRLREPGCSACLAMNDDKVPEGKYCVSTSNRNFEGRQGPNSRTLLASPLIAAAAAIHGKIVDIN